ncbi:hypothetical protein GYMLUDRAFT_461175 [Collybiopsis luxurians FD-317 M1]|uniref:Uncharacterized protein n=1 Tax=Collybiopsis luxurians FD-317 M1 TaxID=944289 RepID=A0A0D0AJS1_9AGAR|nr:hypothetical protein GYMLUDRAFT_461175 [Collybiopsis luxurians FD-317 M1]
MLPIQRDGSKYKYQILPSPHFPSQPPIFDHRQGPPQTFHRPYENFPMFDSHVTPFAVCVNTLRALEDWNCPQKIQPVYREQSTEHFNQIQDWTLKALLGLSVKDSVIVETISGDLRQCAVEFRCFTQAFHNLSFAFSMHKAGFKSTSSMSSRCSCNTGPRRKTGNLLQSIAGGSRSTASKSKRKMMRAFSFLYRSSSLTEVDRVRDVYLASSISTSSEEGDMCI